MGKNTKLTLLYRDAGNYKEYQTEVLAGEVTTEQLAAMAAKLDDGTYLVAEQVGLPTPSFANLGSPGWPRAKTDHVFTTLADFEEALDEGEDLPDPADLLTDEAPTLDLDVATLVARLQAITTWAVRPEWERMKQAQKDYNPFTFAGGSPRDGASVVRPKGVA